MIGICYCSFAVMGCFSLEYFCLSIENMFASMIYVEIVICTLAVVCVLGFRDCYNRASIVRASHPSELTSTKLMRREQARSI